MSAIVLTCINYRRAFYRHPDKLLILKTRLRKILFNSSKIFGLHV